MKENFVTVDELNVVIKANNKLQRELTMLLAASHIDDNALPLIASNLSPEVRLEQWNLFVTVTFAEFSIKNASTDDLRGEIEQCYVDAQKKKIAFWSDVFSAAVGKN